MSLGQTAVVRLPQQPPQPLLDFSGAMLHWRRLKIHANLLRKWWLRRHADYQPVFVIASYRSGSNLLMSYLAAQRGVSMLSEVLSPRLPIGPRRDGLSAERATNHIRFCLQGERTLIRGCKLMLDQLASCRLTLDDLAAAFPTAKYIILYRQSLAEQFVSLQIARATGQYQLRDGQQPHRAEVLIDAAALRRYCDETRRSYSDLLKPSWLADRAVLLSYEELIADAGRWLRSEVCPLLGIDFTPTQTALRKQSHQPLADRIANYRDVSTLLHSPLCRQHHHLPPRQVLARAA